MKLKNIKYIAAVVLLGTGLASCEDFLDRPTEDNYVAGGYYKNDAECIAAVNYLYNSPWYDFQRGFIKIGEVMSGNMYWGSSPYLNFSVNGTDQDLVNMSYSLWAVIGHSNTVDMSLIHRVRKSPRRRKWQPTPVFLPGECSGWRSLAGYSPWCRRVRND